MHPRMRNKVYEVGMLVLAFFMVFGLIMFLGKNVKAETMIPANQGYVTDQTGILSPAEKQRVSQRLAQFERSRPDRPQFVVLIVKDLPDQGMEQFSTDVFRKWGVGQKGLDNGALWVVHPKADNHADVRLEIGRGLEGAVPDSYASRINRETAGPLWTKGQHGDAIIAIADRLAKDMDPVGKIPDTYYQQVSKTQGDAWKGWWLGLIIFGLGIGLLLLFSRRNRRDAPINGGNVRVKVSPEGSDDPYLAGRAERLRREREKMEAAQRHDASVGTMDPDTMRNRARPAPPTTGTGVRRSSGAGAAAGLAAGAAGVAIGMAAEEAMNRRQREREEERERERRRSRDDSSSYSGYSSGSSSYDSGSSSSSSSSSPSSSDSGSYSSGGGDSGGGGSSDSF